MQLLQVSSRVCLVSKGQHIERTIKAPSYQTQGLLVFANEQAILHLVLEQQQAGKTPSCVALPRDYLLLSGNLLIVV